MKIFLIVIESTEDGIWGRWEHNDGIVTTYGQTLEDLKLNFIEAVNLYYEDSGKPGLTEKDIRFEFLVDLENLFEVNDFINISKLAGHVGINKSLLRQYAKGIKYPSLNQAMKIESALSKIGSNLLSTRLAVK